jgi:N utilization substance protein B
MKINNAMRSNNRNIWSRRLAFQAIYSWSINNCNTDELYSIFKEDENFKKSDIDYFKNIIQGVIDNISEINQFISASSEIDIKNINYVELSILRCFIYELSFNSKFPNEVLLAESVKLASKFGGQDSYKFVNAFLEKHIKKLTK